MSIADLNDDLIMVLRIPAPNKTTAIVIFLHGLGDSGHGWSFLPHQIHQHLNLNHVGVVLPHAPKIYLDLFNSEIPGWMDWPTQINSDRFQATLSKSIDYVQRLIDEEVSKGINPRKIVLGGFSQGGALTQCMAILYQKYKLAGFISLSGYLPLAKNTIDNARKFNMNTPLMIAHGTSDPVVPFDESLKSIDAFENSGYSDINFYEYKGLEHSTSPKELDDLCAFLIRVLDSNK